MPSFVGILEGINIRLLRPVVVTVEHQEDSQAENNESKDKEEPEEILHIVSEVGSVVLLVPFLENIKSLDPLLYSKLTHQKNIRIK